MTLENPITMPSNTPTAMAISRPTTVRHNVSQPKARKSPLNRQKAGQRSLGDAIL